MDEWFVGRKVGSGRGCWVGRLGTGGGDICGNKAAVALA